MSTLTLYLHYMHIRKCISVCLFVCFWFISIWSTLEKYPRGFARGISWRWMLSAHVVLSKRSQEETRTQREAVDGTPDLCFRLIWSYLVVALIFDFSSHSAKLQKCQLHIRIKSNYHRSMFEGDAVAPIAIFDHSRCGRDLDFWPLSLKTISVVAAYFVNTCGKFHSLLTLSSPIPLRSYTLPYWSNPSFLIFDILALWRSGLSARAPEWWVRPVWRRTLWTTAIWTSWRSRG